MRQVTDPCDLAHALRFSSSRFLSGAPTHAQRKAHCMGQSIRRNEWKKGSYAKPGGTTYGLIWRAIVSIRVTPSA